MAKSFYSQDEVCEKLEITPEQLKDLVHEGKLREFRDGGNTTYKASDVDTLVAESAIDDAAPAGSLGGSLSALDMLGTAELTLEDTARDADDGMDLRLADDSENEGPKTKTSMPSPSPDLGASDSLGLAMDDALAGTKGGSGTGELVLQPIEEAGDSGISLGTDVGGDAISLDDTANDDSGEDDKEGTVVTSIGVSVFDEDDEIEQAADPLAQTVVSDSGEALGVDTAGSGSGLLDLTRESDDTSLGAELLDEIYPGDEGGPEMGEATRAGLAGDISEPGGSAAAASATFEPSTETDAVETPAVVARTRIEFAPDAISTGLTGMLFIGVLVMCLAGLAAAAAIQGSWPSFLELLSNQILIVAGASLGAALLALGVGFMLGKRSG